MEQKIRKDRLSNVELLRLIAMFGVLIVHTDFGALQEPTTGELLTCPGYSVTRILIESFALVSVNVFVLISGWFGITFRWRGLCNLLFQTFFFFFGIYVFLIAIGQQNLTPGGIYKCMMLSENAWFVKAYLGMYILAPAINELVKNIPRKQTKNIIISFYLFQTVFGWISEGAPWINMGYSSFSFIGLYLVARYVRTYKPNIFSRSLGFDLAVYSMLSLATAVSIIFFVYRDSFLWSRFMFYTSPLTIMASLYLLLAFSKWSFKSKFVNSVAASCFAVYLMHYIIFPTYMRPAIQWIASQYGGFYMVGLIGLLLIAFFITAILIDRIRLYIWKTCIQPLFHD